MLRLLLGKDWKRLRSQLLSEIGEDVRKKKAGRVYMVPELVSHEAERALCEAAGDTASRYAEVLSFTRLCRSVSDAVGALDKECLDGGGRVAAMAAAARSLSSRLKAYAALESKPEFLKELVDAVDEFKRCCITPEALLEASAQTTGAFAQKLEELGLLMQGYDGLCAQGKRDPRDRMTWLLEVLEGCDYAENHVFYIDGFPDFTRQNLAILEHLCVYSPSVTVALNCDCPDSKLLAFEKAGKTAGELIKIAKRRGVAYEIETQEDWEDPLAPIREKLFQGTLPKDIPETRLQVFTAQDPWQETLAAAQRVKELLMSGVRCREITLVVSDLAAYSGVVGLIFKRMGIPVYQAGTEEILTKSVISTVLSALDAVVSGFEQRATLRYVRSSLSPLTADQCDKLENYAFLWRIRGKEWFSPWKSHPDGLSGKWEGDAESRLEELNGLRLTAMAPLERLGKGFENAKCLSEQVTALYGFLREIHLEENLEALAKEMDDTGDNRSAQILNQLWEILLSALEQMYDTLGGTHWETEHFARLFRLLLSQYDVGTIPPVLDAVQMGPVSALRLHPGKHLIVLGAKEGALPGYSGSKGVLTDQERVALRKMGVTLTGGAEEGIQEEFAEIYGVFCGATESICVYCSGDQPSYLFTRLAEMVGGAREAESGLEFACAGQQEAGAWLARWGKEDLARDLDALDSYRDTRSRADYRLGGLKKETVRALYGKELQLSASQVDTQGECRLLYFLKYGLRAKERKEAEVDPAEFGSYVHAVLEHTGRTVMQKGGFHSVSLEETLTIARGHADAYAKDRFRDMDSQRLTYLFQRNNRELSLIVEELWKELSASSFRPVDFELAFGKDGAMPAIRIPNSAMPAFLRGYVDRVDAWENSGGTYLRVADYKTGKKSFDYCDISQGVGLQMLLYLFALERNGDAIFSGNRLPGGVEYFPARVPYIPADGPLTPEEAEEERTKNFTRSGLFLEEDRVLRAMEPEALGTRLPVKEKKDGTLTGSLATSHQFKVLEGFVFHLLADMVREISSGNVSPNPYSRGSAFDACRFCPYGAVCHPEKCAEKRNFRALKAQEFWELVEKEENHG